MRLSTEVSEQGCGAVLEQKVNYNYEPLGFFSKHFNSAQLNYSVFDKELTAAFLAVRHFRHLLDGNCFALRMDNLPTVQAFRKISDPWSSRQSRMLQYIEFPVTVEYEPGDKNEIADLFSGSVAAIIPPSSVSAPSLQEFIAAQSSCKDVKELVNSPSLCIKSKPYKQGTLFVDTSTGQKRILVSTVLLKQVFGALHNLAHPGIRGTNRLISQRYMWRGLSSDVKEFCNNYNDCQRSKVHTLNLRLQQFLF